MTVPVDHRFLERLLRVEECLLAGRPVDADAAPAALAIVRAFRTGKSADEVLGFDDRQRGERPPLRVAAENQRNWLLKRLGVEIYNGLNDFKAAEVIGGGWREYEARAAAREAKIPVCPHEKTPAEFFWHLHRIDAEPLSDRRIREILAGN